MERSPLTGDSRNLEENLRDSKEAFLSLVWPFWHDVFGSGCLVSVEGCQSNFERLADLSGTDAFFAEKATGTLVPIASRVEFFDKDRCNPFRKRYWEHYPRFTVRLAKQRRDGSLNFDVECRKRLRALRDEDARRYLPLYTIQSLVGFSSAKNWEVIQTVRVRTEELYAHVADRGWYDASAKGASRTRDGDVYRIVTVEKLVRAGINVDVIDRRAELLKRKSTGRYPQARPRHEYGHG